MQSGSLRWWGRISPDGPSRCWIRDRPKWRKIKRLSAPYQFPIEAVLKSSHRLPTQAYPRTSFQLGEWTTEEIQYQYSRNNLRRHGNIEWWADEENHEALRMRCNPKNARWCAAFKLNRRVGMIRPQFLTSPVPSFCHKFKIRPMLEKECYQRMKNKV